MADLHYFHRDWIQKTDRSLTVDVCVYGASSAGIVAAIESTGLGKSVALLQPGKFIGGLTTGGLGMTDYGKRHAIGGRSREFYRQVGRHYGKEEEWAFEPNVAEAVYGEWLKATGVTPLFCQYLERVDVTAGRITRIALMGGLTVNAKIFVDASYEGDLMAKAGVTYHVGRESNAAYGETLNGIQVRNKHQFVPAKVSPYIVPNDPSSGLLPQVEAVDQAKHQGEGDRRVQAYNFRICMTDDPALKTDWQRPERYDERQYELAARWFSQDERDKGNDQLDANDPGTGVPRKFELLSHKTAGGHRKTDTNNHGPVSSDFIGMSWDWADGCYELREERFQQHVNYQKGLYWFMANSPKIPERYRLAYSKWGLSNDEFKSTGGWPPQLYVREARRMIADYVMIEADTMHKRQCEDPVAMGSYALDSHNCTRFVNADGLVMNDGDVQQPPPGPYGISYRSIVPKRGEVTNLFVPVCCSASHIAYGSVRMEPVFMALGESTAVAASMAIDAGISSQDVPYPKLRETLLSRAQVLSVK